MNSICNLMIVSGINMYHYMLDIGKFLFHAFVHTLRDFMCRDQGNVSVRRNLKIDIDLVSELSGVKQINTLYSGLSFDKIPDALLRFFSA